MRLKAARDKDAQKQPETPEDSLLQAMGRSRKSREQLLSREDSRANNEYAFQTKPRETEGREVKLKLVSKPNPPKKMFS
jgi:hypothetical protein